jgi:hypothetical protein
MVARLRMRHRLLNMHASSNHDSKESFTTGVTIKVFKAEFHVHSVILKIGSTYWRKFLDSADKAASPSTATFRYEYVHIL